MERTVIAMDIAKQVFQLHWVEHDSGAIERAKLKRSQVLEWFASRQPAMVVMDACGGAHHWARQITALRHEVRLLHPQGRATVRQAQQDRRRRRPSHLGGEPATGHAICAGEDACPAGGAVAAQAQGSGLS